MSNTQPTVSELSVEVILISFFIVLMPSDAVTVIVAVPSPAARRRPSLPTETTSSFDDVNEISTSSSPNTYPSRRFATASIFDSSRYSSSVLYPESSSERSAFSLSMRNPR